MKVYNIFPEWLYNLINKNFLYDYIYEIRIRANKPIMINYKGKYIELKDLQDYTANTLVGTSELISYILTVVTKQSIYAYNEQIKECYITTDTGIRIGICGTVVYNNGLVSTIKNVSSINIRISHQVMNVSEKIINLLYYNNKIKNTLIISPPGAGKTTLIRDIILKLSDEKKVQNILVVDERYEIVGMGNKSNIEIGKYVDVISGSKKEFAFSYALKTMCPSVIATDEISKEEDIESIKQAIKSGVSVIASAHAKDLCDLKFKNYFSELIKDKYFERIIVLSTRNGVGTIEGVFDESLHGIYMPFLIWN